MLIDERSALNQAVDDIAEILGSELAELSDLHESFHHHGKHERVANLFLGIGKPDGLEKGFCIGPLLVQVVADVIVAEVQDVEHGRELRQESSLGNVKSLARRQEHARCTVVAKESFKLFAEPFEEFPRDLVDTVEDVGPLQEFSIHGDRGLENRTRSRDF